MLARARGAPVGRRLHAAALLLGLLTYAFAFQGSRGLWEPDEGRYTAVAVEMLRLGDPLVPMLHHERPHFTKPPLTYWTLAAAIAVGGTSEWAVRAPNALAFAATVLLLVALGRRYVPERPRLPALLYATALLPYAAANAVTTDTLLAWWEALAAGAYFLWLTEGRPERTRRRRLALMWAAFGLAFLTKGPPGLLPLAAIAAFHAREHGLRGLARLVTPGGLALFTLLGLGWYAAVVIHEPALLGYFLRDEVLGRIAGGIHHRHGEWYGWAVVYLPTLLVGLLPWWPAVVARLLRARGQLPRPVDPATRLLLWWALLPLAVFVLARSRLPLYLLPLCVPLALLGARAVADLRTGPALRGALATWIVALVGLRAALAWLPSEADDRRLASLLGPLATGTKEMVFVDDEARYGLAFYLGREVERVCLRAACASRTRFGRDEPLAEELEDDRVPLLLLFPPDEARALAAAATRRDFAFEPRGRVGRWEAARVRPLRDLPPARGRS